MYASLWAYPWDLLDEGPEQALDRIAEAGISAVSVAAVYHHVRQLCPHNPRRAVYHGEGGVVYFRGDFSGFRERALRPVLSELARDGDPFEPICAAAKRRGLKVHAWTVLTHNSRLGSAHPGCVIQNAFGDPYPFGLCPANPEVRAYAAGIVSALAANSGIDCIELESLGYMGLEHSGHHSKEGIPLDELHRFLLSLCFCSHCRALMQSNQTDAEASREAVVLEMRAYFQGRFRNAPADLQTGFREVVGDTNADGILAARDEAVLSLLEELYWLTRDSQELIVMVADSPFRTGPGAGITLSQAAKWSDRLLAQAFARETTALKAQIADIAIRKGGARLCAGLQAVHPYVTSADELGERCRAAVESGADDLHFYHYGLMPLENLGWIRESLARL